MTQRMGGRGGRVVGARVGALRSKLRVGGVGAPFRGAHLTAHPRGVDRKGEMTQGGAQRPGSLQARHIRDAVAVAVVGEMSCS